MANQFGVAHLYQWDDATGWLTNNTTISPENSTFWILPETTNIVSPPPHLVLSGGKIKRVFMKTSMSIKEESKIIHGQSFAKCQNSYLILKSWSESFVDCERHDLLILLYLFVSALNAYIQHM